jgi:hypothetical protein
MMGGEAFILLKAGHSGPESEKQTEIRLAILRKIVQIARPGGGIGSQGRLRRVTVVFSVISAGYG